MFQNLTDRLSGVARSLSGRRRLTEGNVDETLREVRIALLEADVGLDVIKKFIDSVRERAIGQNVVGTLTPGQTLVGIVRDELTALMGGESSELNLVAQPPVVILMAGLQGSGKTTTAAKLARRLKEQENKQVGLVTCDVYRPAATEQLQVLGKEIGIHVYPSAVGDKPEEIALAAVDAARKAFDHVLIVDTAGRLAIDEEMMREIQRIHSAVRPHETLFVMDSMMGQDAVATARAFDEALPITGLILTKIDGDARGGAALSVRHVTGKPIKYLGTGEKTDTLELFHPDRIAQRILGMGDVLSLIEEAEQKVDRNKAIKVAEKLRKGKGFDLADFRDQLEQMGNMGGMSSLLGKLPGMSNLPDKVRNHATDDEFKKLGAIIDSMTVHEKHYPAVIKASRKRRIASGSGTQVQDVSKLLKQFHQVQKMMKKISKKGGMKKLMSAMQGQSKTGFPIR